MNHFFPSGIQSRIKISIVAREEGESHVDERYDLVKTDGVGSRTLILLMTLSLTIK